MSKAHLGTYLRTQKTWEAYKRTPRRGHKKCFMCTAKNLKVMAEFDHWIVVENQYPYDAVAEIHHMLIPREHKAEFDKLTRQAIREFFIIKARITENGAYDCIVENFPVGQSHPSHLHYHLIRWKRHDN